MDKILKDKIKELRTFQLAKNYLIDLKKKESEFLVRKDELEKLLNKRLKLIDKLSNNTLLGNYLNLVGRKKDALELSKEYYFDLAIEYNEIINLIDKIKFEKEVLSGKIKNLDTLKSDIREEIAASGKHLKTPKLKELLRVIRSIDDKIGLTAEIEEAIKAGSEVNRNFNKILKYIVDKSSSLKKELKKDRKVFSFDINKVEKYQSHVINLRHSMLKFESEVNDIYLHLFKDRTHKFSIEDNFFGEHRNKLFEDLKNQNELIKCYEHLKNQKEIILNFTRTLRSDLKKLNKEIDELELLEDELINDL